MTKRAKKHPFAFMFRLILKWATLFGILIGIALGGIIAVFEYPTLLINPRSLAYLNRWVALKGMRIHWDQVSVEFARLGIGHRQILFTFEDFTVTFDDQSLDAHLPHFKLGAILKVDFSGLHLLEINPVEMDIASLESIQPKETEEESPSSSSSAFPSWLAETLLGELQIQAKNIHIQRGLDHWNGHLSLKGSIQDTSKKMVLKTQLQNRLRSITSPIQSKFYLDASIEMTGKKPVTLSHLVQADIDANFHLGSTYHDDKSISALGIAGHFEPSQMKFNISGNSTLKNQWVNQADLRKCEISLKRNSSESNQGSLKMNCPVELTLNPKTFHPEIRGKIENSLQLVLKSDVKTASYPPSAQEAVEGTLEGDFSPFDHPLLGILLTGKMKADIRGIPNQFPKNWKLDADIHTQVKIKKFETVVSELEDTPFAIPAPFRSLRGSALTEIKGKGNLALLKFPYSIKTDLKSTDQKIHSEGKGTFFWKSKKGVFESRAEMDLLLSDIQLVMPKMEVGSVPQLLPDARIKKSKDFKKQKDEKLPFTYLIHVHTREESPIRIISNFSKKSIPVLMDLKMTSQTPIEGALEIKKFPIELFRRPAELQRLFLHVTSPAKYSEIDGEVTFKYSDYKITLELSQTLEKPRIKVTSDPYLPENQVFATLLFGAPIEQLDSEQAASAGEARAAVQNGAMDLISLYVLASTPIQSVHYDPVNQILSAKVKLEDGTSLNIGADTNDLKTLGIRKRLGKHWVIQTDLNNPVDSDNRNISTFIEWNYRH